MHEHNDHVKSVVAMHETLKNPALGGRDVIKYVFEQKVEYVEEDPKTGQRDRNVYNKCTNRFPKSEESSQGID